MALCHNCGNTQKEYFGNGGQNDFTWDFPYNQITDVKVAFWDSNLEQYVEKTSGWIYLNATTIRFDDPAPAPGQKFIIYRCSSVDPLPAEFFPGTPIKATELNDNFNALKYAIQELPCDLTGSGSGGGSGIDLSKLNSLAPIIIDKDFSNNVATFSINLAVLPSV